MLILKLRLKTARELIQLEHDATMGSLRVAIVRSSVSQSPSTIKAPRWVDLWQCVAFPEGDLLEIGSFSPFAHSECRTVCHRTPTGLHHSERTKYWLLKCETENDLLLTLAIENPSSSNSQRLISESTAVSSCTQFSYLWLCGNWVQSRKLDTKYLQRFVVVFMLHVESELKRPSPGQCPFTKCFIFINKSEASSALGGLVRQIVFLKISKLLVKVDKLMGKHRR